MFAFTRAESRFGRPPPITTRMDTYLVSYEYGSGTIWGYVAADGPQEVAAYIPEVDVWEEPPAWLASFELARLADLPAIAVDAANALDELFGNFRGMNSALAS